MKRILLFQIIASIIIGTLVRGQSVTHPQHVFDSGGGKSSGGRLTLSASIGQPVVHTASASGFDLEAGYIPAIRPILITTNVVKNGDFESGTEPWTLYTIGGGRFDVVSPGFEGMYAGSVSIARTLSLVSLYQPGLALEANTKYRLSFAAYSTTGHDMVAFVTTGREMPSFMSEDAAVRIPWIIKMYSANLGKSWHSFSTEFETSRLSGTATVARLTFLFTPFARAGDVYYIDDVVLEKLDAGSLARGVGETIAEANLVPEEFSLAQNYPNPFNPSTTICYALPVVSHVSLKVYNVLGQDVATLVDEVQEPGYKSAEFYTGGLASGVYLYRMAAGSFVETKRLLILK